MAGEVTVDALPYFDQGYDEPGVREAAYALVEEECRRYRPTKNYLEYLPPPDYAGFETEVMKNEFERLASRQPMEMLSMKRYELPQPLPGRQNDLLAWNECIDNSMAQLEHQSTRIQNLELMSKYGSNAWRAHNEFCILSMNRKRIQEINWERKSNQTRAGSKIKDLENNWVGLVTKNYEIERAILDLERETETLQQKQKQGQH
uniref:Pre-mRNA-splicing factor SPF27 n=1 Tax=Saccoglossus kowalevskii TaxID=10224 RepID=A0ABM0M089_SACKO|nr:PREDICTED: pre-mRNA-splicing factor SPF27-like [Saccoglossus kowalevskii]